MSNSKINAERIHQAFQGKNKEETILDIVIFNVNYYFITMEIPNKKN